MPSNTAEIGVEVNAVGVNSGDGERAMRSRGRIGRLEQALADEGLRPAPRAERIDALKESIEDESVTLAFMLRKIKKQQA